MNALQTAHDDVEREGVYVHLARIKMVAGRFDEARAQLDDVTNSMYDSLKNRLKRLRVYPEKRRHQHFIWIYRRDAARIWEEQSQIHKVTS